MILDTDILSEILKEQNSQVRAHARSYLRKHQRFTYSALTVYEIVRGLRARGAMRQLAAFLETVKSAEVLPISLPVLMRAAELWAYARLYGHPAEDVDLIIAATALETGRVLVTGNTKHFEWIPGLSTDNWRSR